jgi:hypothetical protein
MVYNMINKFLDIGKIITTTMVLIILSWAVTIHLQIGPPSVEAIPFRIIPIVKGGTGATTAAQARINLGVVEDLNDLGNPSADKTFSMGVYGLRFDWTSDDAEATPAMEFRSDALETDTARALWKWTIDYDNATPANRYVVWQLKGTSSGIVDSGKRIINTNLLNFSSIDNIKINSVSINALDMGFAVSQSLDGGADLGEQNITNVGDVALDSLTADGTNVTLNSDTIIADAKSLTFDESAADPDDADVKLSATDGKLTIVSVNGANNNDITIDTDGYENVAAITSSTGVGYVVFSSIALRALVDEIVEADNGNYSSDGWAFYGTIFNNYGAGGGTEIEMADAEAGMSFKAVCGAAQDFTFDPDGGDRVYLDGTDLGTDGDKVTMDCSAIGETMLCFAITTDSFDWICECSDTCTDGGA